MFDFNYTTDIAAAVTLGASVAGFIIGGFHMTVQGNRSKRLSRRLEYMIAQAQTREINDMLNKDDGYPFVTTSHVMCGGCGQSVPTKPDGFTIKDHDCPYAEQPNLFVDNVDPDFAVPTNRGKKIPIGFTGHLHKDPK
jgi:hypothetical protein